MRDRWDIDREEAAWVDDRVARIEAEMEALNERARRLIDAVIAERDAALAATDDWRRLAERNIFDGGWS